MVLSFEYNGIASMDMGIVVTEINKDSRIDFGLTREIMKGDKTKYRTKANHFGTTYSEVIEFDISIAKKEICECSNQADFRFTSSDIRKINGWLTSPQFPKLLKINNEDYYNEPIEYFALIDEIEAENEGDIFVIKYHVTCDSPFGYTPEITHTLSSTITMPSELVITNNSDDYEEYVYPRFEIHPTVTGAITIENLTDGHSMSFNALKDNDVIWDCQKMQFKDFTGTLLSFEDMGVSDVDYIYWYRLCHGENRIKLSGGADIKIIYREPRKVGAF